MSSFLFSSLATWQLLLDMNMWSSNNCRSHFYLISLNCYHLGQRVQQDIMQLCHLLMFMVAHFSKSSCWELFSDHLWQYSKFMFTFLLLGTILHAQNFSTPDHGTYQFLHPIDVYSSCWAILAVTVISPNLLNIEDTPALHVQNPGELAVFSLYDVPCSEYGYWLTRTNAVLYSRWWFHTFCS